MSFTAELSCLKNHSKSKMHLSSTKATSSHPSLPSFIDLKPNEFDLQVQRAEIKFSALLAEHNVAFQFIDHLEELMKNVFPDSAHKDILIKKLNFSKFSIMVDESTDIGTQSHMCIVVRFYDHELKKMVSKFWDLVPVYDINNPDKVNEGATAKNLFECIINSFKKYEINVNNIIGFGSDGCASMMGKHNSVSTLMKEMFPGIMIVKCICHSLHLCCSQACKSLPRRCEDLARNIYNFFGQSSKRQSQFVEFQNFCSIKVHKILHPSQTRWLSLLEVVNRILEQWEALRLFFTDKWLFKSIFSNRKGYFAQFARKNGIHI